MILKCNCKHTWQDERYGAGMRVMNWAPAAQSGKGAYRCTVCQALHGGPAPTTTTEKKGGK